MAIIEVKTSCTLHIGHVNNNEFGKAEITVTADTEKPEDMDVEIIAGKIKELYDVAVAKLDQAATDIMGVKLVRA